MRESIAPITDAVEPKKVQSPPVNLAGSAGQFVFRAIPFSDRFLNDLLNWEPK